MGVADRHELKEELKEFSVSRIKVLSLLGLRKSREKQKEDEMEKEVGREPFPTSSKYVFLVLASTRVS